MVACQCFLPLCLVLLQKTPKISLIPLDKRDKSNQYPNLLTTPKGNTMYLGCNNLHFTICSCIDGYVSSQAQVREGLLKKKIYIYIFANRGQLAIEELSKLQNQIYINKYLNQWQIMTVVPRFTQCFTPIIYLF